MSRKATGRPNGRPRTRELERNQLRRCHTAMLYWMLRNESLKPAQAYEALGGRSAVTAACSEFKNDDEVTLIRRQGLSRAEFSEHMDELRGRMVAAQMLETYSAVRRILNAMSKAMPVGRSVLAQGAPSDHFKKPDAFWK